MADWNFQGVAASEGGTCWKELRAGRRYMVRWSSRLIEKALLINPIRRPALARDTADADTRLLEWELIGDTMSAGDTKIDDLEEILSITDEELDKLLGIR